MAQLHIQGLEDMENIVAVLRKSLPLVPNQNTSKIPVQAQYAPPPGSHVFNLNAYVDKQDCLLSVGLEKTPYNLMSKNVQGILESKFNITTAREKSQGPTLVKKGGTKPQEFIWGQPWNARTPLQPLMAEKLD